MIFNQNRQQLRQMYLDAWKKHCEKQVLEPLQQQMVNIILLHPEYQMIFSQPEHYIDKDYLPEFGETNPFLHMSLHMGIHEQVSTNRPNGINKLYQELCIKYSDIHEAEHKMIDCLAEALWSAQRNNTPPDEKAYLEALKKIL